MLSSELKVENILYPALPDGIAGKLQKPFVFIDKYFCLNRLQLAFESEHPHLDLLQLELTRRNLTDELLWP